jgi:hypothetical protein
MNYHDTSTAEGELFERMLPPWNEAQAMQRVLDMANATLSFAAEVHSKGNRRESFVWAIRAAVDAFKAFGASGEQLVPLQHLAEALLDLEHGRVDPALAANPDHIQSPGRPAAEWSARACLAGALEARMRAGKKASEAARQIANKIDITGGNPSMDRAEAARRLVGWRSNLLKGSKAAPLAARDLFEHIIQTLDDQQRSRPSPSERHSFLSDAEKRLIKEAAGHRRRVSPQLRDTTGRR